MCDDTSILTEMMLQAEIFCSQVEGTLTATSKPKKEDLRLKIAQCRGALAYLQGIYEDGQLTIDYQPVPETFRHLVKSLMWVSFHGGPKVDFKLFRELVQIQSKFTSLLLDHMQSGAKRNQDQR